MQSSFTTLKLFRPLFKSTPKISIFCSLNAQKLLLSRFVEQNIMIKTKTQTISFAERHYLLYIHRSTKSALHVWVFLIDYFNNFQKNLTSFCIIHDAA